MIKRYVPNECKKTYFFHSLQEKRKKVRSEVKGQSSPMGGLVNDNCCFFFGGIRFLRWSLKFLTLIQLRVSSSPADLLYIAEKVSVTLLESPKSITSANIMLFNWYHIGNSGGCRNSWVARTKRCHCEYNLNALHQMIG